jgi:hypothetical protein
VLANDIEFVKFVDTVTVKKSIILICIIPIFAFSQKKSDKKLEK